MTDQGQQPGARAPGWHRDPFGRFYGRYWDGQRWTDQVVNEKRAQATDPPGPSPADRAPVRPPDLTSPSSPAAVAPEEGGRRWRTWHLLAAAGLAFLLGAVAGAGSAEKDETVAASGQSNTTQATLSHVQVIPPPSTPAPTPPPTTKPSREAQLAAFTQAFERTRVGLADAIKKDNPGAVSSVDRFEYDPTGPTVILSVSSDFRTPQYLQDSAWAVTKSMQPLWEARTIGSMPDVIPRFRLTVGTVRYNCPHDFMVRLAELRASREDWEATCRA